MQNNTLWIFGFIAITVFAFVSGKIVICKFSWNNNEELSQSVGQSFN